MEKRCSDGVRAIAQLLHTIWPVGPGKPIYSVQSIIGATLKRRDGSEREGLVFTEDSAFSEFINTDLLYNDFTHLPCFLMSTATL